jgi:hypothetical protein
MLIQTKVVKPFRVRSFTIITVTYRFQIANKIHSGGGFVCGDQFGQKPTLCRWYASAALFALRYQTTAENILLSIRCNHPRLFSIRIQPIRFIKFKSKQLFKWK